MTAQNKGRLPRLRLPWQGRGAASTERDLYGLVAEFETPEQLTEAARSARNAGYRRMDAYSPYPIEDLAETIGFRTRLPLVVLIGGLTGASGIYLLQYWINVVNYDINVGGRPLHSWPAFIPATFEGTILLSAFAATFGMILLNGLPRLYHPIFNAPNFDRASRDRFFLCIEAADPKFDLTATRQFLEGLGAEAVSEVEN